MVQVLLFCCNAVTASSDGTSGTTCVNIKIKIELIHFIQKCRHDLIGQGHFHNINFPTAKILQLKKCLLYSTKLYHPPSLFANTSKFFIIKDKKRE